MLTFVFEFGKFCGDNSILVIDQPEDNLDNKYIYQNLVASLKNIKNERQVIIVTHSSTIVTNADAEQVIVMDSDNEKAWITKDGYPEDTVIIKHIVNNLEGGIDAFKHKKSIYNVFLKKNWVNRTNINNDTILNLMQQLDEIKVSENIHKKITRIIKGNRR